jgi:hypothetical protein
MKKLLLSFAGLAFSITASAQYYHIAPVSGSNPNNVNQENSEFPVGGGLPTDWTSIVGAAQTAGTYSSIQTLPFTFKLQGAAIDSFRVSNTGILTFSRKTNPANHSVGSAQAITNSSIPDSSICVLGLNGSGANDQVVRKTFGTSPNRQEWFLFASYSVTGAAGSHWSYWSIVLEETTNNIYIVDQRNAGVTPSLTIGVRVNSTNVYDQITSVGSNSINAPDFLDNTYYTFIQGVQPDYDLAGSSLDAGFASPGVPMIGLNAAPFTISADFINNGAQNLTSATFNYSVNGSTPMTSSLSSISIPSGSTGTLTSGTTWNPSSTGLYNVKAWLSGLNGSNVDANTANDTVSLDIQVVTALTTRYPLYETFTSSTCGPCTPANATMEAVFDDNPGEHNSIKYQMSWPGSGDPYYTTEGGARRTFYGVNSVPRVEIDGGWDGNGNGVTQALYDQYKNVPSFLEMTATWSRFTKSIETEVTISPLADVTSNNLRLFAVIYSHRDTANEKTNGETEFFNVVKKMMPNENGETLSALTAGQSVTKTLSYTFNGNYTLPASAQTPANLNIEHTVEDFTNLGVILWVQDIVTKEVFQSVDATYTIGQFEESLASKINVYPNPTSGDFFVEGNFEAAATLKLMDMTGRTLYQEQADFTGGQKVQISTEGFAAGTYLLITTTEGASHAQPVIVK